MDITEENNIAHQIIGFAIEIHKSLGPGLTKSVYLQCLSNELNLHHLQFESAIILPIQYKGITIENAIEIDFLIADKIVLLIETIGTYTECHAQKLLRILKLKNYPLGLLIHFNNTLLKDGIRRVTNIKPMSQITESNV